MRHVGLDVHRDFLEVALAEQGVVRRAPRVGASRDQLQAFAATLRATTRW